MVKIPEGSEYRIIGYIAIVLGSLTVCLVGMIALFDRYQQTRAANTASTLPAPTKITPQPTPAPKLELLDLHWQKDGLNDLNVTIKNISQEPIRQILPYLISWTKDGQMIKRDLAMGNVKWPLMPGQSSTFYLSGHVHSETAYFTLVFEDDWQKTIPLKETAKARIDIPAKQKK